jgi:uncharacterized protein YcaQ
MPETIEITKTDARKLFLAQQGLLKRNTFGRGRNATLKAVERLSYVQIDTISVVSRAHEQILKTRIENFTGPMLQKLQTSRHLFEYWGHAAAYLPFEHYRYYLPVMAGFKASRNRDKKLAKEVVRRIAGEGPLQSRDFEDTRNNKQNGWWEWKPAKQVLEHLFLSGELMITRRDGFQKVYDLRENVIPAHIDVSTPTKGDWSDFIVLTMVQALGVATEADLGYARPTIRRLAKIDLKQSMKTAIDQLLESGNLVSLDVDGTPYYSTPGLLEQLPLRIGKKEIRILSPFDNLIINRKRCEQLFKFDYQLECYVPAHKRKYGYFTQSLLYGDKFIGRMDAKAKRDDEVLIIKNLVLEPAVKVTDTLITELGRSILDFATANGCTRVTIDRVEPKAVLPDLQLLIDR